VIFDAAGRMLAAGEDVGRHNALDKVVGKLFLQNRLQEASILVLSSRVSYELVQKAARARIPVILSVSRPTALGVDLADRLGLTLACMNGSEGLYVFTGSSRLG
jgi:FdhD protein